MTEEKDFVQYNVDVLARATVNAKNETEAKRKAERSQYEYIRVIESEYVEKSDLQLLHEQQKEEEAE